MTQHYYLLDTLVYSVNMVNRVEVNFYCQLVDLSDLSDICSPAVVHFTCFILTATLTLWQGQKRTKNYLDMYRPQGNWIVDSNLCYWIINLLGVCCNQTPWENRIRLISTACVPNARVVWFPVLLWRVSFLFLQFCDVQIRSCDLWFNFWLF